MRLLVLLCIVSCCVGFACGEIIPVIGRRSDECDSLLKGNPQQLSGFVSNMKYIGTEQKIVLVLTSTGGLYRSSNEGLSWTDVRSTLERGSEVINGRGSGVRGIYQSKDAKGVVLTSFGDFIWVSIDSAMSFKLVSIPDQSPFYVVKPHPFLPKYYLALSIRSSCYIPDSTEDCHSTLYAATDGGFSWKTMTTFVMDANWGDAGFADISNNTVYFSAYPEKSGNQYKKNTFDCKFYRSSIDSFSSNTKVMLDHGLGFLFYKNQYMFVAQAQSANNPGELSLWSSVNSGKTFTRMKFPKSEEVKENRYTILDVSERTAVISVDHSDGFWGHLYDSDSLARDFAISLRNNKRERSGHCDFSRANGIEGVFFANVVQNPEATKREDLEVKTYITLDKGGEWRPLSFPEGESCTNPSQCQFHITVSHKLLGQDQVHYEPYIGGPLYTKENAVGLIIASGKSFFHRQYDFLVKRAL
eukprot:TRINITY_DN4087_c0_g1_i2.p1 TRINITY_DN4087_c0_g1~~TRINITY_DN4087_c0_g1_i2.p1  ORF type:complete len:471 (-),score=66.48 TRINITY_DN4087_c0_g1_i2:1267-2679(-)